jgi:plasmid stabilization system protein ParE
MSDEESDLEAILAAIRRGEEAADAGRFVPDPTGNPFATHLAKVVWAEPAWADLEAIQRNLARHGRRAAKETIFAITAAAGTLTVHSLLGPTYPPSSRGPNREFDIVGRFRIFYRFVEQAKRVEVLAIRDNSPEEPPFSD